MTLLSRVIPTIIGKRGFPELLHCPSARRSDPFAVYKNMPLPERCQQPTARLIRLELPASVSASAIQESRRSLKALKDCGRTHDGWTCPLLVVRRAGSSGAGCQAGLLNDMKTENSWARDSTRRLGRCHPLVECDDAEIQEVSREFIETHS